MITQNDIDTAFQMIVSQAADNDLIMPAPPKNDNDKLTAAEQQKMLAVFARCVFEGHPGFTDAPNIGFTETVKNNFKTALVKLYLSTNSERTVADMGKELFKFSKKYIPDNHFNVFTAGNMPVGMTMSKEEHAAFEAELKEYIRTEQLDASQRGIAEHLYAKRRQAGENLFDDESFSVLTQNGAEILTDKKGKTWRMSEVSCQGKKLMMIGMTRFAAINENGNMSEDLINDFTALAQQFSKQEYLSCDALVLDLRGNGGGWPYLGDYMARTLYGNTVSTEPLGHVKRDTLPAKLSYAHMENRDILYRKNLVHESQNTQYDTRNTPWAETYPFNPALGYKKPILILTDQSTGSNAELTIGRLKEHPYVRTVGEHSCGVIQYHPAAGAKTAIPLPYGLKIAVPPEGFTGAAGERLEGLGYRPDYQTAKGENAMSACLQKFDEIEQDIMQNLPAARTAVHTAAARESKVDETTAINRRSISNNSPSLQKAFENLVKATETIPQLTPERDYTYNNSNHRTL